MITAACGHFSSRIGNAAMPSRSGISTSSTITSGLWRSTWATASRPLCSEATRARSGSLSSHCLMAPRATAASSTTMTRIAPGATGAWGGLAVTTTLIRNSTQPTNASEDEARTNGLNRQSDQADFLQLGLDDLLVERLHDVFVGAGMQRARDMRHIVLGRAEHHLGTVAAGQTPQRFQEIVA